MQIKQELTENSIDCKNLNELLQKYQKLHNFYLHTQKYNDSLEAKIADMQENFSKKQETFEREMKFLQSEVKLLKMKNNELLQELNMLRKKKLISIETFNSTDSSSISKSYLSLSYDDLKFFEPIGEGASGKVFKAEYREVIVAAKKIEIKEDKPHQILKELLNELKVLESIRHPNILTMLGITLEKPSTVCIVTEHMANGSLKSVLSNSHIPLSMKQKLDIASQVALAMHYLHNSVPQILHRDLKSANVLIDEYFRAKICDFG